MSLETLRKNETTLTPYLSNQEHLSEELQKLDLLIQYRKNHWEGQFQQMGSANKSSLATSVYISSEEVDALLKVPRCIAPDNPETRRIHQSIEDLQNQITKKVQQSIAVGTFLALPQLAHIFALSPFEIQVVLICLAPELQRKYDKIYAYLQDDITRKKPSLDLILDLLCNSESERWSARALFSKQAPLLRAALLEVVDDPQNPSGASDLARFFKLDTRILNYLLDDHRMDDRLIEQVQLHPLNVKTQILDSLPIKTEIRSQLSEILDSHFSEPPLDRRKLTFHLHGPAGVGKRSLALALCHKVGAALIVVNTPRLLFDEAEFETLLQRTFRESLLQQTALHFEHCDILTKDTEAGSRQVEKLIEMIQRYGWLCFLSSESACAQNKVFQKVAFHEVALSIPGAPIRKQVWTSALSAQKCDAATQWAEELAAQFQLTPGKIQDAVQFAVMQTNNLHGRTHITRSELSAACRLQSNQKLQELATKISPHYAWQDIVLPKDKRAQLKEVCQQVKHRVRVFEDWGFAKKLSHGKGLSVLFSGPPGTGKTMAAEVIANALHLDLYKIDLSSIVSKYIGETEKNLSKIFQEAETSNAILFFDEADALFGKRTEVSDAHDRYANIETSYLLQKMEEYEGVVILATNLRDNMDEAFTRRIRFIIEFPFPEAESRLQIWKTHFPKTAPLNDDIDFDFLAKRVQVAGGNIKNIVLNAAFCAAEEGSPISMRHLIHGIKREYEKIGKMWAGDHLSTKSRSNKASRSKELQS